MCVELTVHRDQPLPIAQLPGDRPRRPWLRAGAGAALLAGLLAAPPLDAQQVDIYDSGGVLAPEQAAYDVTFYELDLNVDPGARHISGSVTMAARMVTEAATIALDLDTLLTVEAIHAADGRRLEWSRDVGRILIHFGDALPAGHDLKLTVDYAGQPRVAPMAPWEGGFVWSTTQAGYPWIATAVQGEGSDVWWPSKDHVADRPDSVSIRIRVPEPLVVATNGRLQGFESHSDGTRTFHHFVSTPISAYNVALNIAPYRRVQGELQSVAGESFPVTFYALPESEAQAIDFLPEVLDHLSFYEELLGPYPFRADGYAVAQTPHLGMEHQTVIAYGANFDPGAMTGGVDWGFDALHHHELAHEWWGNMVTNADWKDMWLHEGFASYMQALYAERLGGPEWYRGYLAVDRQRIVNRAPVAPRESRTAGEIYSDSGADIYMKGSWILHSLRWTIGDEPFFQALRRMAYPDPDLERMTDGSHVRYVTTDDFLEIASSEAAAGLDWFFEVYLRQPALPRLSAERRGESVRIEWIVPGGLPFPMPVEVEADGIRRRLEMVGGSAEIRVPAGAEVVIDPDARILRDPQARVVVGQPWIGGADERAAWG